MDSSVTRTSIGRFKRTSVSEPPRMEKPMFIILTKTIMPNRPSTMDGTVARLSTERRMHFVSLFSRAYSAR